MFQRVRVNDQVKGAVTEGQVHEVDVGVRHQPVPREPPEELGELARGVHLQDPEPRSLEHEPAEPPAHSIRTQDGVGQRHRPQVAATPDTEESLLAVDVARLVLGQSPLRDQVGPQHLALLEARAPAADTGVHAHGTQVTTS